MASVPTSQITNEAGACVSAMQSSGERKRARCVPFDIEICQKTAKYIITRCGDLWENGFSEQEEENENIYIKSFDNFSFIERVSM